MATYNASFSGICARRIKVRAAKDATRVHNKYSGIFGSCQERHFMQGAPLKRTVKICHELIAFPAANHSASFQRFIPS